MFGKLIFQVIIIVVALIPVWIFLVAQSLLSPSGFFENVVMLILAWIVLGGLQIAFLIFGLAISAGLWAKR